MKKFFIPSLIVGALFILYSIILVNHISVARESLKTLESLSNEAMVQQDPKWKAEMSQAIKEGHATIKSESVQAVIFSVTGITLGVFAITWRIQNRRKKAILF
jgi:hypothetical protein